LSFYEGVGVVVEVLKIEDSESEVLKIEESESESELFCTDSTALLCCVVLMLITQCYQVTITSETHKHVLKKEQGYDL
jgi:hypothetical protein